MKSVHKLSRKAQERRREKDKKRIRRKHSLIPYTGTDKKRFSPPHYERYVNYSYIHSDTHGGVLIHFFKNVVSLDLLNTL